MRIGSNSEDYYLQACIKMVEEKLGWGSSNTWSHNDFLEASEKISQDSGIPLSVSTIKRIWGKVKYDGSPTTATLNALVIYLGYENWRTFKLTLDEHQEERREESLLPEEPVKEENREEVKEEIGTYPPVSEPILKPRKKKQLFTPILSASVLIGILFYFSFMK